MEQPMSRADAEAAEARAFDLAFHRFVARLSEVPQVRRIGATQNLPWTTLWVLLDADNRAAEDRLRDIEDEYLDHVRADRFYPMHVVPLDRIDESALPLLDTVYERT